MKALLPTFNKSVAIIKLNQSLTLRWNCFVGIYSERLCDKPVGLDTAKEENMVLLGDKMRL